MKRNILTGSVLLFLLFFSLQELLAQDGFAITEFSTRDGLPHNNVKHIAQDSTGFLWLATWDGLSRFDGYEFRNYYHNPDDSTTIPYFTIAKIVVDRKNNVWAQSDGRTVTLYDRAKDHFVQIGKQYDEFIHQIITVDHQGDFWKCNYREGLEKYDDQQKRLVQVKAVWETGAAIFPLESQDLNFSFDNLGHPWLILNKSGSWHLCQGTFTGNEDIRFKTRVTYPAKTNLNTILAATWIEFEPFVAGSGRCYFFTLAGLFSINDKTGEFEKTTGPFPPGEFEGRKKTWWSPDLQTIQTALPGKNSPGISVHGDLRLQDVFTDNSGILWYSCMKTSGEGTGLTRAIPIRKIFRHHLLDMGNPSITNAWFAASRDRLGNLWAASRNLSYFIQVTPGGEVIKHGVLDERTKQKLWHARSFLSDESGMWIGYYYDQLLRYDFSTGSISEVVTTGDTSGNTPRTSFKHLAMHEGQILAAGDYSFSLVDSKTGKILTSSLFQKPYPIYAIKRESSGHYWLGTAMSRLFRFDPQLNLLGEYRVTKGLFNVEDMAFSHDGSLWIALLGGGICHFDPKTGKSRTYTTADGLSNNTCYSILEDRKGNLWISTDKGLSRLNPATGKFRIFGPTDGLKIEEFNSDAAFLAPDGEMIFGGMGGLVSFYPDSLEETEPGGGTSPLVITELTVEGKVPDLPAAIYDLDTIRLGKGTDNLQISFASLGLRHPDKIRYRYRMTGENEEWAETGFRNRSVNFGNLDPGNYRFELEATNQDGAWSSHTSLLISIPPYFYQTIWFNILVALLILLLAGTFIMIYNRQVILKARQQQEELRLESLRGQMNPHFIFNSLNSINYFISQNDRLSANRYIADFSRLIRTILENMSNDYIPFYKEWESIRDYMQLEHLRFGDKFDYELHLDDSMKDSHLPVFPGLIQPFLENAIWHGVRGLTTRKGNISVTIRNTGAGGIQCVVEDDGIGRELAEERINNLDNKTSMGIGIVRERLRIINNIRKSNYNFIIEDRQPGADEPGTRVTIDLPVKNSAL